MRLIRLIMVASIMSVSAMGCAHTTPEPVKSEAPSVVDDFQKSADKIHGELVKLTRVQQQKNSEMLQKAKIASVPEEGPLSEPITLSWSGPIEQAVGMIAEIIGYDYETTGSRKMRDKIVSIDVIDEPIFKVLEDIGWQAGEKIGVIVNQGKKAIMVAYAD